MLGTLVDMRVLGLSGAHRLGGNTDQLVERVLSLCGKAGFETDFVTLADKDVGYCTVCNHCQEEFACSISDDVFGILVKMAAADAIIVGSPTYFASVSGRLKAFFDRTIPLRRNGFKLAGKIGGAVTVGGSRNGGQEHAISDMHDWMLLQELIVVSDKRTAHFGGITVGRSLGGALEDEEGLKTVDNLAEKIIETLGRLRV